MNPPVDEGDPKGDPTSRSSSRSSNESLLDEVEGDCGKDEVRELDGDGTPKS